MFYFNWALRNVFANKRRTAGIVIFISLTSSVLFINYAFLSGSEDQMKNTLRNNCGDITIDVRDNNASLETVLENITEQKNKYAVENIITEYTVNDALIISETSYLSDGKIKGVSSSYFSKLSGSVDLISGKFFFSAPNQALIEKSMAKNMGLAAGDKVVVEYKVEEGAINTSEFYISGIFTGNKYIHQQTLFVDIKDTRSLAMAEENKVNHIKLFITKSSSDRNLKSIINNELEKYKDIAYISVWEWDPGQQQFFKIFNLFQVFLKILLYLITAVILVILFFGIQNILYLTFVKRANEISVLSTFGMPFSKIYRTVLWEVTIWLCLGLISGFIIAAVAGKALSNINLSHLSDEMIVVMGGTNLTFIFNPESVLYLLVFISVSVYYAGIHALSKYFAVEVSRMKNGIR